ncbi:MAG: 2-oxoacid:acceptor oxidoreductase family protein [Candidatus Caldatribacterium sp.]|uniref:2-oxoacid:acceptor oxidoreductase family protein n=1 Tax=Candidatus Caldatribacterium sp. TaxID=2282143 RepID=UPI002991BB86|nr:2-oxoacid:acceptor oxidoreductase family protein [Candidatus Caldatribacterium sp.]MCX7730277.1 2-oxoacid:acceptor oxidoreductase family protein [Candidatus Caldatribacterium sp.]MDW8080771.1 2-oxoacid:acceptor oxidoreductase family protein [Candidatus Calescibacterium sp.]
MKHHEILVAGFGGQGILFLGRTLALAGMLEGYEVSWYPSYGPEMRGGTANCTVIISEEEIGATISEHPDVCIVMNEPSLHRFAPCIRPRGLLVVNVSLVRASCPREDLEVLFVPANDLAKVYLRGAEVTNTIILGAFLAHFPVVRRESAEQALAEALRGRREELYVLNLKAFEVGWEFVTKGG